LNKKLAEVQYHHHQSERELEETKRSLLLTTKEVW